MDRDRTWVVMPFVDLWFEHTLQAAVDVLEQTAPARLLLIDNGSGQEDAAAADRWLQIRGSWVDHQAMIWHFNPSLSLSVAWNTALKAAWAAGADRALVVNNDVRLPKQTVEHLSRVMDETGGLFVSAINVAGQDLGELSLKDWLALDRELPSIHSHGGPDYSCFLISRECHDKYPFDEQFTYCNDLDHHRRIMLAGEGKRIFSVCVPYLHYASRTINRHPGLAKMADRHRELYREKWGGPVNQERCREPYAVDQGEDGISTPELQRACLAQ